VEHFRRLAAGEDDREVVSVSPDKSISHEITFDQDLLEHDQLLAQLQVLTEAVARRLRQRQLIAQTVVVKIRDPAFHTVTRSRSMRAGSNNTMTLYRMARALFEVWRTANHSTPVRLLGMGVSALEQRSGNAQTSGTTSGNQLDGGKEQRLDQVLDSINTRYGDSHIVHGLTLLRRRKEPPES
jgi:DNA polymerase-4